MKVHIVSETEFATKGQGVHTAYIDLVELLKEKHDIDVVVNKEGSGDIFHSHTYGPYYFWKGRNYKGRRVLTVHVIPDSIKGSFPFWKQLYPAFKWYIKKVYSYADVCIAISPMVEQALKDLGVKTEIVRIYNPIPVERWKPTEQKRIKGREKLHLLPDDFVVLGVGQLQGRKGVEDFIDMAEAIPNAKFVWAGGRPFGTLTEGVARINDRIAKAPKNIQFTGLLDLQDMPDVYAAADMLIFPSYQENCPLAPLEAAACGLPVIFRNLKEYKLLYQSGYLMANNNKEFIDITRCLMSDKIFYNKGIELSRKLVSQFDRNEIRRRLISLYQRLIHNHSASTYKPSGNIILHK